MTTDPAADGNPDGNPEGIPVTEVGPINPAGAEVVDRATQGLAASTDRDPSPGLLPAVMQTVWAELRPGQQIPLPGSEGTLLVTETAVGNALVAYLDGMPELLVRRCDARYQAPVKDGSVTAGGRTDGPGPGGSLLVTMTASIAYGTATDELVDRIRSVIAAGAEQLFGLTVSRVDVEIVDVYPAPGTPR